MEENQPKTGKFAWTYGLLLGAVSVIFSLMLFSMDMHYDQGWEIQVIGIILMIAAILLGISQYKKANAGFLKVVEGLKIGVGIGLISALIALVWYALLTNVIEPDFLDNSMEIAKVKFMEENPQMTDEQWQQGVEMRKSFAWVAYPFIIIINLVLGLIIGAIAGAIMKKNRAE